MVLSDISNLKECFVTEDEVSPLKEEEIIFLILINDRPYGYYYSEDETAEQLEQAKEHVLYRHLFDFKKNYYWNELPTQNDTILKLKLVSNVKDHILRYDCVEDSIEIIRTRLLRKE
jgi:hypothetical protein